MKSYGSDTLTMRVTDVKSLCSVALSFIDVIEPCHTAGALRVKRQKTIVPVSVWLGFDPFRPDENHRRRQTVPTAIFPSLHVNLLCRPDWPHLRGVAETECAILPIREFAAYPWCSACKHLNSGAPPGASVLAISSASRRIQLAARHNTLIWEFGQSGQLLLQTVSMTQIRIGRLSSGSGRRIIAKQRFCLASPFVSPVCALPPRVTAERRAKNPTGVVQNI